MVPPPGTTSSAPSCIKFEQAIDGLWASGQSHLLTVQGIPENPETVTRVKDAIASGQIMPDVIYLQKLDVSTNVEASNYGLFLVRSLYKSLFDLSTLLTSYFPISFFSLCTFFLCLFFILPISLNILLLLMILIRQPLNRGTIGSCHLAVPHSTKEF